ncbi:HupE/UreJ family protein [Altererythrobacter sp. H2]|uniref:HupE/UreJ family protein n=1 Tax=Altererythrobacter sp. H2 TaxID=3108391 RepID=UPI002B4BBB27|nr:HupE/UreJ family protein [Altererythrobacter sp. H2]WRK96213.1 HupE/UreJ family protein [Altererythrobacter sp. H2]
MRTLAALLLLWLALAVPARADELRPGYIEFAEQAPGQWSLAWKRPYLQPPPEPPPPPILPDNCTYQGEVRQGAAGGAVLGRADVRCTGAVAGKTLGVADLIGQTDLLARVIPLDAPAQAIRITAATPQATIAAEEIRPPVWRTYFVIGVEHILEGWDHLLFVIALVLLLRSWRQAVIAATAFTVAHSITLAGASLGWLAMPQRPVEVLIALSIVFLAVEIARRDPARPSLAMRLPWVVAFLFGLLHGFGFAGALAEIGLPDDALVPALVAFNLGVEAGQLLVVGVTLAAIAALTRVASARLEPAMRLASYGIGITGAYWLVDRLAG